MTTFDRRNAIVKALGQNRQMTTAQLAARFNVTERTIRNDITALTYALPVLTVRGRFGGVRLADWYHPGANKLALKQEELLQRLKTTLTGDDLIVLNSILVQFSQFPGC